MGICIYGAELFLQSRCGNWLERAYIIQIPIFVGLCFFGIATFAVAAKLTGAMDIKDIVCLVLKKSKKNA